MSEEGVRDDARAGNRTVDCHGCQAVMPQIRREGFRGDGIVGQQGNRGPGSGDDARYGSVRFPHAQRIPQ